MSETEQRLSQQIGTTKVVLYICTLFISILIGATGYLLKQSWEENRDEVRLSRAERVESRVKDAQRDARLDHNDERDDRQDAQISRLNGVVFPDQ